jgi:hypothetical protein
VGDVGPACCGFGGNPSSPMRLDPMAAASRVDPKLTKN